MAMLRLQISLIALIGLPLGLVVDCKDATACVEHMDVVATEQYTGQRCGENKHSGGTSLLQASTAAARVTISDSLDDEANRSGKHWDGVHPHAEQPLSLLGHQHEDVEHQEVAMLAINRSRTASLSRLATQAVAVDGAVSAMVGTFVLLAVLLCVGLCLWNYFDELANDVRGARQSTFPQDRFVIATKLAPQPGMVFKDRAQRENSATSSLPQVGAAPAIATLGMSPRPAQDRASIMMWPTPATTLESKEAAANSASVPPPSTNIPSASGHFCPDLVVPEPWECTLLVPIQSLSLGQLDVVDVTGKLVLSAIPNGRLHGGLPLSGALKQIVLTAAAGNALAMCRPRLQDGVPTPGLGFELIQADGPVFATLCRTEDADPTQYTLTTVGGARYHVTGAFDRHSTVTTNEDGAILASTERFRTSFNAGDEYYRLRAEPLTDIGLVLCSLLSIMYLDAPESAARASFH